MFKPTKTSQLIVECQGACRTSRVLPGAKPKPTWWHASQVQFLKASSTPPEPKRCCPCRNHWIGLRENLQKIYRKPWFLPWNIGLSCKFSHHPILWLNHCPVVNEYRCGKPTTGWWYTYPSEKYESQLGWLFPIYRKHVPNHQSALI